jgi:hypothetical protein
MIFPLPQTKKFFYQMEGQENNVVPSKKCTTIHPPQTEDVACPHATQSLQMGYDLLGKYVAQNHLLM